MEPLLHPRKLCLCYRPILDPQLAIAEELERIALEDEYFVKRKLYPNVDFYSGIVLRAIGIPTSMYTVMFAMARCVGWFAHWLEMTKEDQVGPRGPQEKEDQGSR